MIGNGEYEDQNSSGVSSFWDCREYHRTVKRVDAANKLCSELCLMIQERAEIEKAYSSNLKKWSSRWLSFLDSGLEYGSGSFPWKGLCKEAEAISNIHQGVRNALIDEIQIGVKQWQKEHFHKSSLPPHTVKETKQFEQDFEIAQKQWSKRLKKVHTTKKEYYQACKTERSSQVQVQNAKSDPSGTAEQLKKIQEKLVKAEKDVQRTRNAYKMALTELDTESARYVEEMTRVFNRTQDFERERLNFFKETFNSLHNALNVCAKADYDSIYNELAESISQCDVESDLNWWSSNHGVDMPFVFPHYEEYSPEITSVISKKRSTLIDHNSPVTLTNVTMISSPIDYPSNVTSSSNNSETNNNNNNNTKLDNNIVSSTNGPESVMHNPFDDKVLANNTLSATTTNGFTTDERVMNSSCASTTAAPGGGGDSIGTEEINDATYDDGRPGVKVRALYDYVGQEDDEISFVAGDVFEKLEEADDQGWCKGRKGGRAGLYPANYVEEL
ncbi:hypothetical protein MN116_003807 [Schistosoma mekongi]|uniref:Uncharacterized protein n=1 Tax=Schistosoma mekongi TaxID=38744 RepID=A0AAE1ZFX0_SCHME|nr:hypothetical protein MN116_003807 [Schistosoma mekongi]